MATDKPEVKKKEALAVMVDRYGNQLTRYDNGAYTLSLVSENGRERQIGLLKEGIMFMERKDNHFFYKAGGYGFNYMLLKHSKVFEYIILTDKDGQFKVPRQTILDFGKVMEFKHSEDGNNFEIQIFLKYEILKKYKVQTQI